ncbi:MAG: GatB/YqeY domain-containing protein [Firmicutes bacterium]|nr:GatB/YqeY domain-containing protein [Bacillota bacterium]
MDIVKNIDADIVSFMKNQDKANLTTLRMAKNALQSEKIRVNHELNDDEIINTLKKFVKQKKDNIEEYTKYGKDDIVNDLKREVELVSKYLPEELSEDEINKGLDEIFAKVNPTSIKDMGRLMAEANTLFGVKADKSLVSKLIKDRLI